jgi:hypothetical protein
VAVEDTWGYHWHNIPSRMFVHLFAHVPAEAYIALTADAGGGIAIYGLLFFAAPLLGLIATYVADRSSGRVIFTYACLSTACLCPLVFGFPTEMWFAHSLFWPALAASHFARVNNTGAAAVFLLLLALAFTHEGALILTAGILATTLLEGVRSCVFKRAGTACLIVLTLWIAERLALPPDEYFSSIITTAALNFVDVSALADNPIVLLVAAIGIYGVSLVVLRQIAPANAHAYSTLLVVAALTIHWLWFDRSLLAENRYAFRTALLVGTPVLGALAAISALYPHEWLYPAGTSLFQLLASFRRCMSVEAIAGAILIVILVHGVETAKFVSSWADYRAAVLALTRDKQSDPWLGDPAFVSAERISSYLRRLSWSSTTPYLSVVLAPQFQPNRLVVEPHADYFWLPCKLAAASQQAERAIPSESRRLVRKYACLHRPR